MSSSRCLSPTSTRSSSSPTFAGEVRVGDHDLVPHRGQARIALRVGKVLGRRKVGKHFTLEITETRLQYTRDETAKRPGRPHGKEQYRANTHPDR